MWSKDKGYWTYSSSTPDTAEIITSTTEKPKRKPRKKKVEQ